MPDRLHPSQSKPADPVEANLRATVDRWRDEILRLRKWINTEGRDCPSNSEVDAVLEESHRVAP